MLQTILIPKAKFSLSDAIDWVSSHHYSAHKVDITDKFYRFRQHTPYHMGSYYTITLPNGIELVHENPVK